VRVAVMSDIHGFDLALAVVLADIDSRGGFDEVVVAGDLCILGPAPARALDMLRERGYPKVRGNGDQELIEAAEHGSSDEEVIYALAQIGDDGVSYLAELPFDHRISPPGSSDSTEDLLVVHANPHDLETKLKPDMSDRELLNVIGGTKAGAIAFGHHHVAFSRRVDDMLLTDVSAVGNPKDRDLRCKYGIINWDCDKRAWSAQIMRLDYPLEETLNEIRRSALPDPEKTIRQLLRASY
jgi:predicted phosphodiesterase